MRLAIAFGARGKGKALAHYEPARVVINLTKMKGAGSLAHEWAHAFDDTLGLRCGRTGVRTYLSETELTKLALEFPVAEAMKKVKLAIKITEKTPEEIEEHYKNQMKRYGDTYLKSWIAPWIRDIERESEGSSENKEKQLSTALELFNKATKEYSKESYEELIKFYKHITGRYPNKESRDKSRACIEHAESLAIRLKKFKETGVELNGNMRDSNFYNGAKELDKGRKESYYARDCEMFARCFEAYIEDQLRERGLKSQYLVHSTGSNKLYGEYQPYPEGEERKKINAAIANLVAVAKQEYGSEYGSANYSMYNDKNARVSYIDSIKLVDKVTGEEVGRPGAGEVKTPIRQITPQQKAVEVTDLESLRQAIVAIAGNNTERGKQIDCARYMNSIAVIGKMKIGYAGVGFNDFKANKLNGMGNSKSYIDTQTPSGRVIYIDSTQKPDKQLEGLTEAIVNRLVSDKLGNSKPAQMVAEGATYAICKRYGLDVRTYCLNDSYTALSKNKDQAKAYIGHCKNMYNYVMEVFTH